MELYRFFLFHNHDDSYYRLWRPGTKDRDREIIYYGVFFNWRDVKRVCVVRSWQVPHSKQNRVTSADA